MMDTARGYLVQTAAGTVPIALNRATEPCVPALTAVAPHRAAGLIGMPRTRSPMILLERLAGWPLTWLTCFDWATVWSMAALTDPAAVVLDRDLGGDGLPALAAGLRQLCGCRVYVLGRTVDEQDPEVLGADGVLDLEQPLDAVPLGPELRASTGLYDDGLPGDETQLQWAGLRLDRLSHSAYWKDSLLPISGLQFRLLWTLGRARGGVVEFAELSRAVYGRRCGQDRGRVQAHVRRLRRLIELDPINPTFLVTVWGRGFRLADE